MPQIAIFNHACYEYLRHIAKHQPQFIKTDYPKLSLEINETYQEALTYGHQYYSFLNALENALTLPDGKLISHATALKDKTKIEYQNWINAIFLSPHQGLSHTSILINSALENFSQSQGKAGKQVTKTLKNEKDPNSNCPQASESLISRSLDNIGPNYKPMIRNGLPCQIKYAYQEESKAIELRLSTQGERHYGFNRLSPLFAEWLRINEAPNKESCITHVYFNLLKHDAKLTFFNFNEYLASLNESWLASPLIHCQKPNLAVITLPAHGGFFNENKLHAHQEKFELETVKTWFLQAAMAKSADKRNHFIINDAIKEKLYGLDEKAILNGLLVRSTKALKLEKKSSLSSSQMQALWFHFIRAEFAPFALNQLNPFSFNFTCKEGIDRGGISSAYFNLMQSFNTDKPMSQDEFLNAIHGPAAMVKGRGLNFHHGFLFNAIHHYVKANQDKLIADRSKHWLIHWRNDNTPYNQLSEKMLADAIALNQKLVEKHSPYNKQAYLAVLNAINTQLEKENGTRPHVDGKRSLMDCVSICTKAMLSDSPSQYQNKVKELAISIKGITNYRMVGAYVNYFLGWLLSCFSFGKAHMDTASNQIAAYQAQKENRLSLQQSLNGFFEKIPLETKEDDLVSALSSTS